MTSISYYVTMSLKSYYVFNRYYVFKSYYVFIPKYVLMSSCMRRNNTNAATASVSIIVKKRTIIRK